MHLFVCLSAQHWFRFSGSHSHDATSPPANFSNSSVKRKAVSDLIMPHSEYVVIIIIFYGYVDHFVSIKKLLLIFFIITGNKFLMESI